MSVLLPHEGMAFKSQTVYTTGHAYFRCTFDRCTLVYCGGGGVFQECTFNGCVWHLNFIVHDPEAWDAFMTSVAPAITKFLPRASDSRDT